MAGDEQSLGLGLDDDKSPIGAAGVRISALPKGPEPIQITPPPGWRAPTPPAMVGSSEPPSASPQQAPSPTGDGQARSAQSEDPPSDARSAHELTQLSARGLPWMAMSRVGSELVLMVSMVILARIISPSDFGAYAVALIVVGLALGIPTAGVGNALVQRSELSRAHLEVGVALAMLVSIIAGSLTLFASYVVIAPLVGTEAARLVRMACPLFLLCGAATVPLALLRRRLDFRRLAAIEVSSNVASAGVALSLAILAHAGGDALVAGALAGSVATTAIAVSSVPPPVPRWRRAAARDISEFGLPAGFAAIAWTGFANGDYAVVAARLGTAVAGQYWRAYTLAVGYQGKIGILMQTFAFPVLSRSATSDDLLKLRARMVRVLTVCLFPLLTGLAITAPIVVPAVYGQAWTDAIVPTQVLCAGGAATLVIDAIGAVLMAAGRARGLLGFGVAHFMIYVGSVVIVAQFGLVAVAIDGAIVHGAFAVVAYAMIARGSGRSPIRALWHDIAPATLSCFAMAAAAVPVYRVAVATEIGTGATFALVFAACALAYLLTLRLAFKSAWDDLYALIRRFLPARLVPRRVRVLRPLAGDRSAA